MGWDGSGWRVTPEDVDTIERMGGSPTTAWIVEAFLARRRAIWDWASSNGLIEGRACWDEMPPSRFGRLRRIIHGRPMILPVTEAALDLGPVNEAIWNAVEGGRPLLTARLAEQVERTRELVDGVAIQGRRYGEIRGRVVQHGRIEHGLFGGDEEPLVLRECLITDTVLWGNTFDNVVFVECDFSGSTFGANHFRRCQVVNCFFDETRWGHWTRIRRTLRGATSEEDPAVSTQAAEAMRIAWSSLNSVSGVEVRGNAVSVSAATGVGATLFMPDPLASHFHDLATNLEGVARSSWETYMSETAPPQATAHNVLLSDVRASFTEYRRAAQCALWRVGRQSLTPPEGAPHLTPADIDPVAKLDQLRGGYGSISLNNFNYAVADD